MIIRIYSLYLEASKERCSPFPNFPLLYYPESVFLWKFTDIFKWNVLNGFLISQIHYPRIRNWNPKRTIQVNIILQLTCITNFFSLFYSLTLNFSRIIFVLNHKIGLQNQGANIYNNTKYLVKNIIILSKQIFLIFSFSSSGFLQACIYPIKVSWEHKQHKHGKIKAKVVV